MEAHSFFERAGHAREIPSGLIRSKAVGNILRTQNPGVVGEAASGMRPAIGIHKLAGRANADFILVECVVRWVLDKMEQMSVRPVELLGAVDPEGVIPDNPAAAGKLQ